MAALSPVRSPSGDRRAGRAAGRRRAPHVRRGHAARRLSPCDVQDPGNVGAIVRVAEAGGATGVVAAGALRRSVRLEGAARLDGQRAAAADRLAARHDGGARRRPPPRLPDRGHRAARRPAARRGRSRRPDRGRSSAAKAPGCRRRCVAAADERVTIPMEAPVESLNAAVSAALMVYEARRQRHARRRDQPVTTTGVTMDSLFPDEPNRDRRPPPRTAPLAERMRPRTLRRVRRPGGAARARASRCARRSSATCCSRSSCGDRPAPARRRSRGSSPTRPARQVRLVQRGAGRHQGDPRGHGRGRAAAPRDRPPHDRLHRRDPPLQQGAAGRVPAARRGRRHRADRRDDREPVVRGQRRAAVALEGVRAARADRRRGRRRSCERALADPERGLGRRRTSTVDADALRAIALYANGDARVGAEPARAERRAPRRVVDGARRVDVGARASRRSSGARCSTTRPARSTTT